MPSDAERLTLRFYILGPLFSAVEVACEHLNRMLDAARIRVCSVVNTEGADSLLVAILACRPGWLRKKTYNV
jgi:hypothetical protein